MTLTPWRESRVGRREHDLLSSEGKHGKNGKQCKYKEQVTSAVNSRLDLGKRKTKTGKYPFVLLVFSPSFIHLSKHPNFSQHCYYPE